MADTPRHDEAMPDGTLAMLRQLLQGAAPADATFTTAKGEGGIAKARRDALAKLHPPTTADRLMQALAKVGIATKLERPQSDIRESAPVADFWPRNPRYDNVGLNGNVLGGRVMDSTALRTMKLPDYNQAGEPHEISSLNPDKFLRHLNMNPFTYGFTDEPSPMADPPLAEQIARLKAMRARNSNNPG